MNRFAVLSVSQSVFRMVSLYFRLLWIILSAFFSIRSRVFQYLKWKMCIHFSMNKQQSIYNIFLLCASSFWNFNFVWRTFEIYSCWIFTCLLEWTQTEIRLNFFLTFWFLSLYMNEMKYLIDLKYFTNYFKIWPPYFWF